jgi:hypothetical protein
LRVTEQELQEASHRAFFHPLRNFLFQADAAQQSDVIFVRAGRPERKVYGMQLFHQGIAPRLILSVGRFEVRKMDRLGFQRFNLRDLTSRLPPDERHFFIDIVGDSPRVTVRGDAGKGTYAELLSLSRYLESDPVNSLLLVSTSVHLGRVRHYCQRITYLSDKEIRYVPVPEDLSSFRKAGWWKHHDHWSYVLSECAKLGISVLRRPRVIR